MLYLIYVNDYYYDIQIFFSYFELCLLQVGIWNVTLIKDLSIIKGL